VQVRQARLRQARLAVPLPQVRLRGILWERAKAGLKVLLVLRRSFKENSESIGNNSSMLANPGGYLVDIGSAIGFNPARHLEDI
jgi:hypothetical protein